MIAQVITENGVKKLKPLTADAGAGNPVGTIIPMYKKSSPSGYLYCDGSTFDETLYPLLYAYLGSNVLPDYREFALVGAEENTTDTIATHDVFTEGQFKDDQLQDHTQRVESADGYKYRPIELSAAGTGSYTISPTDLGTNNTVAKTITAGRHGTVTRGKRKAVYFYIKATSGLSENAQDNVINTLNEQRSYSTEEVNTGKKWKDGKTIYRKVVTSAFTSNQSLTIPISNEITANDYQVIDFSNSLIRGDYGTRQPWGTSSTTTTVDIYVSSGSIYFLTNHPGGTLEAVVEYTKTT